MNTYEAMGYFKISPEFMRSAVSGFWIRVIQLNGSGDFTIDEPSEDEDFGVFETQFAVALGFTDAPEVSQ